MNALEQFSQQMKTLDEVAAAEAKEQQEQKLAEELKTIDEETNRFSLIVPATKDFPLTSNKTKLDGLHRTNERRFF